MDSFRNIRLLIVGDLIIDRYCILGRVRESPEVSGLPIVEVTSIEDQLGGAGGVALIAKQLGAQVTLWSASSMNDSGTTAARLIHQQVQPQWQPRGLCDRVSLKERHLLDGKQFGFRRDLDCSKVYSFLPSSVHGYSAILLADYGKGVLTDDALRQILDEAAALGIPTLVDPARGRDWAAYRGATLIKCNHAEWVESGYPIPDADWLVVTRGAEGMALSARGERLRQRFPAEPCEVLDTTGAGDAVLAALGCALAAGIELPEACRFANQVAARKCGTRGVALPA